MRCIVVSSISALNKPQIAINKIIENGRTREIVAVCRASKPFANKKAIDTIPDTVDQNMRCQTGELSAPLDASKSTTKAPESAEVTKNTKTMTIATNDVMLASGRRSRNAN